MAAEVYVFNWLNAGGYEDRVRVSDALPPIESHLHEIHRAPEVLRIGREHNMNRRASNIVHSYYLCGAKIVGSRHL